MNETARLSAAVLTALALALAQPAAAQDGSGAPISFYRGVNLFPWFSYTRDRADDDGYFWPPFQLERAVPTRADLEKIRQIGMDFVRLPIDPGPLIFFHGAQRDALMQDVENAVRMANESGLKVIVDLHPNEAREGWDAKAFIKRRDRRATYEDLAVRMARLVARRDPTQVALELMNEPAAPCTSPDWASMQEELLNRVRPVAPRTTVIVTGPCGSALEGLLNLRPLADPNLIYTFHYYTPFFFTHQGATWTADKAVSFLDGVPWPASAGSLAGAFEQPKARLAAADLPVAERVVSSAKLSKWLLSYFQSNPGQEEVRADFAKVVAWRDRNGLRLNQVLLGEFGVVRRDPQRGGAAPDDRERWVSVARKEAEAVGMSWAFWNYFDRFGLVLKDSDRSLDPRMVRALTGN